MTELYWLYALGVYLTSGLMYLTLVYNIRGELLVDNVIVAFVPALNTLALGLGLSTMTLEWYKKNKTKVLFKKLKKIPKPPKPRK